MSSTDGEQPAKVLCEMYFSVGALYKINTCSNNGFGGRNTSTCRQKCEKINGKLGYIFSVRICFTGVGSSAPSGFWFGLFVKSSPLIKNE